MSRKTQGLGPSGSVPDPVRSYWRVVNREAKDVANRQVITADGRLVGVMSTPELALAAVGGHNRDLKLDRLVVLDDGHGGADV